MIGKPPGDQSLRMPGMNGRDRVLAALYHMQPNRVPLDLWALPPVTDSLRAHPGAASAPQEWWGFEIGLRSVWPDAGGPPLPTHEHGGWAGWWGLQKRMVGPFEGVIRPPLIGRAGPRLSQVAGVPGQLAVRASSTTWAQDADRP